MKKTLLIIQIFAFNFVFAQQDCYVVLPDYGQPKSLTTCGFGTSNTNPVFLNKYKRIDQNIPNETNGVKIVKVCISVFTGPGSLQNTQTTIDNAREMIGWVNSFYNNVADATIPINGVSKIPNTKIQFELEDVIGPPRVFFYNNTNLYNSINDTVMINHIRTSYPERLNYLNILVTTSGGQYATTPSSDNLDYNQYVHLACSPGAQEFSFPRSQSLAHELGHTLDLLHTYKPSCCHETCNSNDPDYLYDLFGINPPTECWETAVGWGCASPSCSNNIMGGNNLYNYYFSPMQLGKIHRATKISSARKYVKDNGVVDETIYVSDNETWDFDIRSYSNIIVLPNCTLTLKCKVSMPHNGQINVMPGGKLIIDGGIVTNDYGGSWAGIYVSGDATKPMVMGGNADHGYVELKNGAKIEKADIGVDAQYGGIINASNSDFYNNTVSIRAANYPGVSANGWNGPTYYPLTGISVVKNCRFNFEQDPDYDNLTSFNSFIKFETIKGFNVLGNTFEVLTPASQAGTVYGKGINAIESAFKVDWLNSNQKNKFTNLEYGIYSGTFYRFDRVTEVGHTDFSSNAYGILLEGTQYSKITQNNFAIENIPYTGLGTRRYGLYLKGCTGYQVNDNNFYSVNGGGELVGCVVWNSLYAANFIKANTFSNLLVGAISSGNNLSLEQITNWNSPNNFQAGLQILCNNFNTNTTDIFVAGGANPFSPGLAPGGGGGGGVPLYVAKGMGSYQGACINNTTTANNKFSSGNHIIYDYPQLRGTIYSHPNNSQFTPASGKYTTTNVVLNNCNGIPNRNCITKYIFNDITAIKGTLLTAKATSNQLKLLLDNNNTSGLLSALASNMSSSQIKNQLKVASPYLSDEVLIQSINRQIPLNRAHLKQVIIDNSPVTEGVMLELNNTLSSFSNGLQQQIINAQSGISERTILQSKIMVAEADAQEAINDAVRYYLTSDNVQSPLDSVISLLETYSNNKINMQLTAFYIIKHDFVKAQQYIDNMSSIPEYADVSKLFNVAIELEMANLKCYDMNQPQKDKVLEVANGTCQNSSHLAEALLKYFYNSSYPEYVEIPSNQPQAFARAANTSAYDSSLQTNESVFMTNEEVKNHYAEFIKSSNKQTTKSTLTNEQSEFLVYPNPAKDQITVFYDFENNNNNTVIELTDISGKIILQKRMPANESEITISLEKISSGFYLVVIKNNNVIVNTKKISVEN